MHVCLYIVGEGKNGIGMGWWASEQNVWWTGLGEWRGYPLDCYACYSFVARYLVPSMTTKSPSQEQLLSIAGLALKIKIPMRNRAHWDLSRKVNLKLEELAHMFYNVKLNFKVGFFWIFFVLTLRHFGNHFGPRKNDFWPFYFFWSFSHWNSHAFTNMHFLTSRSARIKKISKETHLKIQFYIEKHVSQLF